MGPVALDVQALQSLGHAERGIATYVRHHVAALLELRPDLIGALVVNPDLPPLGAEWAKHRDRVVTGDDLELRPGLYHVMSPYEPGLVVDRVWPPAAAQRRLIVTIYDLIPEVFATHYLPHAPARRQYRTRHHLARAADAILALSDATARDVVERLGVAPASVTVIGAGVAPHFHRPADRDAAQAAVRTEVPGLELPFVLYTGGGDHRKNPEALLHAFAQLATSVRAEHQLVVVWRIGDEDRRRLLTLSEELGIADRVLFTGYVNNEALQLLYQTTALFVFPSRYEGYGLPVVDAMACGARVISARSPALQELLADEFLFDAERPETIAALVEAALTDDAFMTRLDARAAQPSPTWSAVAQRTIAVYERVLARPALEPPAGALLLTPRRGGHAVALRRPWLAPD